LNEKESTTYEILWDTEKAVLQGTFISLRMYIQNTERSQTNDLMLLLKLLEKTEKVNTKSAGVI
jgi:hypothetical protein